MDGDTKKLTFGAITIEWNAQFESPIAAYLGDLGLYITVCSVVYSYSDRHRFIVPAGFIFDGASIPWFLTIVPGFAKHDWHLFAALIHDFICDHPEELPRPIGDGIFVSVMLAIAEHEQQSAQTRGLWLKKSVQAWLMYIAVAGFTIYRAFKGAKIQQ